MRAFAVRSFGEAPAIHDLPVPAADGAFLLRVVYAGVNPLDNNNLARLTAGSAYPYVLGIDFAGIVERVPAGGNDLHAGDRVFGMARTHGAYAEYTAVTPGAKAEPLAPIPDGVSDEAGSRSAHRGGHCAQDGRAAGRHRGPAPGRDGRDRRGRRLRGADGACPAARTSSRPSAATSTRLAASAPRRSTTPGRRCGRRAARGSPGRRRRGPRSRQRPGRDPRATPNPQAGRPPRLDDLRGRRRMVR